MLSAIVLACDASEPHPAHPAAVVASLAALVPAVITGIIREASLAVTAGEAAMREIADHAGCRLIEVAAARDVLAAALAGAHNPRVLVVRAGCVPEPGFAEEIAEFLRSDPERGALLRQGPSPALARIFPALAPIVGLLGTKTRLQEARRDSLCDLARTLHAPRVFFCRLVAVG